MFVLIQYVLVFLFYLLFFLYDQEPYNIGMW